MTYHCRYQYGGSKGMATLKECKSWKCEVLFGNQYYNLRPGSRRGHPSHPNAVADLEI